jgi:hypothetical protein
MVPLVWTPAQKVDPGAPQLPGAGSRKDKEPVPSAPFDRLMHDIQQARCFLNPVNDDGLSGGSLGDGIPQPLGSGLLLCPDMSGWPVLGLRSESSVKHRLRLLRCRRCEDKTLAGPLCRAERRLGRETNPWLPVQGLWGTMGPPSSLGRLMVSAIVGR